MLIFYETARFIDDQIDSKAAGSKPRYSPMSISERLSIAWSGSAPYEDTDTLVLTGRTYFVDVRVKKGSNPPSLDWALAGTRTSTPGAKPGIGCSTHPRHHF